MRIQVDTDFLIYALSQVGPERIRLRRAAQSEASLQISAIAWYEFCRGPRLPEHIAVARSLFGVDGVVPLTRRSPPKLQKSSAASALPAGVPLTSQSASPPLRPRQSS